MIVGCVTPPIIVAGVAGLSEKDSIILIQAALVMSALSTLLQLFPFIRTRFFSIGSGLPVIMGISFAYVPTMQAIAGEFGVGTILGAQIVGGCVAILVGLFVKQIRRFFPPLITGTVVFTIGLSLYPTAINYMAGGTGSEDYGSWQNWLVAFITLAIVTLLNHFGKGIFKLASILIGMICGYIVALFFGMVDFTPIAEASVFQLPLFGHFGINFEVSSCVAIGLLFAINSIQAIGDFTATTSGGMDRLPTDKELNGGIVGYGIGNIICALFGGLPTATFSQNVGIVTTTKVVNRCVLGLAAAILLVAGLHSEIFFCPDNHSILCTGWSYRFRIRFYRNEWHEADHIRKDELPEHLHRRSCRSTRYGNFPGKRSASNLPELGYDNFRKITGCYRNLSGSIAEYHFAERKRSIRQITPKRFLHTKGLSVNTDF